MTNEALADRVVQLARQHPPRTPGRRAAGMAYAALITTKTSGAARRALGTFGDPGARAAAATMLDQLERDGDQADDRDIDMEDDRGRVAGRDHFSVRTTGNIAGA